MLGNVQRGLERLYRIDIQLEVEDFLIDAEERDRIGVARRPREQLLISEDDDGVAMGLFLDELALTRLRASSAASWLHDNHLEDFLLVVEGVSHFVCVAWRAQASRSVSALELELQAEIDKYVTCLHAADCEPSQSSAIRRRLFEQYELHDDLDEEERQRYEVANTNAHRYSASLEQRFVKTRRIGDMLGELRRFYRMSLGDKLDLIRAA
jgi:hypothetical protein